MRGLGSLSLYSGTLRIQEPSLLIYSRVPLFHTSGKDLNGHSEMAELRITPSDDVSSTFTFLLQHSTRAL